MPGWLLLMVLALGAGTTADEVEPLQLAARLIDDGFYDRAERVLGGVDPTGNGVDLPRYHTLRGLVALHQDKASLAASYFATALRLEPKATHPSLYVLAAQAYQQQGDYKRCVARLDDGGPRVEAIASSYFLRARCTWKNGDAAEAWGVMERGRARFPEEANLWRLQLSFLIERGLYREALQRAQRHLARPGSQVEDSVAVAEALGRAGRRRAAISLLEQARLRFPASGQGDLALARLYAEEHAPFVAAGILQRAVDGGAPLEQQAAALYRRAGWYSRALALNGRVRDPKEKVRQRLGLFLQMERYVEASALAPRIKRLGLAQEDALRYALAYTHFRLRRFAMARKWLEGIDEPAIFEQAVALARAIDTCADQSGREDALCE